MDESEESLDSEDTPEDAAPVRHIPVMAAEVLEWLDPQPGETYVDGTLGLGGHARLVAERLGADGRVIGLDRDPNALKLATSRFTDIPAALTAVHACSERMREVLDELGVSAVQRILLDLGVSSLQLDEAERGFSFMRDGPLDMRMDTTAPLTAADLVRDTPEQELARIFWVYGEERHSRRIAKRIVEARGREPIITTGQLAAVVSGCVPRTGRIHPATRVFQALRIAVNDELAAVAGSLEAAKRSLAPGGRLVVLTFHSLEDRIVKQAMRDWAERGEVELTRRKVVCPSDEECRVNPRARSTKLRVCERKRNENATDHAKRGRYSSGSDRPLHRA